MLPNFLCGFFAYTVQWCSKVKYFSFLLAKEHTAAKPNWTRCRGLAFPIEPSHCFYLLSKHHLQWVTNALFFVPVLYLRPML